MKADTIRQHVADYLVAKDNNKPHLMRKVFAEAAELRMQVASSNISFPPRVAGEAEITATLVQRFNESHQDIYTFCLPESLAEQQDCFACRWFVCMQDKNSGEIKIGAGGYRWYPDDRQIICLDIDIEQMQLCSAGLQGVIFDWAEQLPWPWCSAETALQTLPDLSELTSLRAFLTI